MTTNDRRGPIRADDLMAELAADPGYQARRGEMYARIQAAADGRQRACQPVVDDLALVGIRVGSLWDLHEQPDQRSAAVPVLLRHLERDYPERILLEIGCALPPKPLEWWEDLKGLYLTTASNAVRDRVAASMSGTANKRHWEDLRAFITDDRLGKSRIYFLRPINRIGNRMRPGTGRAVIESLVADETLGVEADAILKGKSRND